MGASIRIAIAAVLVSLCGVSASAGELSVEVGFSRGEVELIRAWYREHGHEGGHRKGRRSLPPGIAKNLQRGKPLPPGIAKQVLPSGLAERLPPVREGYERVIVDGKVLLIDVATQIIHDVLVDVILH